MGAVCALCRMLPRISYDVRRDGQHNERIYWHPHQGSRPHACLRISPRQAHQEVGTRGQNQNAMIMETKTCKTCGRELPETNFRVGNGGARVSVCNACANEKRTQTRYERAQGGKTAPFYDQDFDGKEPGDVWRQMCRAKKWLESRGYVIQISGEYHETKIRKLKLE